MFFIRLLARLPLSALYAFSDFLFAITYYVARYRRKLVRKNLLRSFPQKAGIEIDKIEREFYHNLCDYAVETIKLLHIERDELAKRVVFKNTEKLEQYRDKNQSIILLASHQFNWEWLVAAGNFSLPVPVDFVYQPIENKSVDHFLLACRSRFGAYPIKRNEVAREIVKRKNIVRGLAIVADQYPGQKRDKRFLLKFLNQDTAFFYGANQLATLTKYPVMFSSVKKIKRGYYEVSLESISEPPYERDSPIIIERYAKAAEKVIQDYPAGWLWSHKRWKKRHLKQASAKYPPASTAS
jgi:Kdo2-lipid IVA lauroyltransferase/acyltransferase